MARHRRSIPLALLSTLALGSVLAIGLIGSTSLAANADGTPTLTVTPATGSDVTQDSETFATSGMGCVGDGSSIQTFLVQKVETAPVTVAEATDILISAVTAPASPDIVSLIDGTIGDGTDPNSTFSGGDLTESEGFPFNQGLGWRSTPTTYQTLADVVEQFGAGRYTLVSVCYDVDFNIVADSTVPSNAVAAVLPVRLNTDGSWATGTAATVDSTTTTVSAVPVDGGGAALTATVTDTSTSGTIPAGTVTFSDGSTVLNDSAPAAVDGTTGKATLTATATQLPVGTHSITATFAPTDATLFAASTSAAQSVVVAAGQDAPPPAQNGALTDGGTVQPGTDYDVSFPGGTFGDGDTVNVVLNPDAVTLPDGTAGTDGSLDYTFSAPSDLVAGDTHTLVFTDASDATKTQTIAFTVAAAADDTSNPPGNNDPSSLLTDSTAWATQTPQGIAALIGLIVLAVGAAVAGWWVFVWRRRGPRGHQQA